MTKITVEDAISKHVGTTTVGDVFGTVNITSQNFVKIEGKKVMTETDTMEIPSHQFQVFPPLFHSHSFTPNTFAQNFVKIEGKKIVLLNDSFSGDATSISNQGGNNFVNII